MHETDTNSYSDDSGIDSHLRRVLTPTSAEAERVVAGALKQRRLTLRRALVPVAGAAILATATFFWQRTRDTGETQPKPSVVTVGELIVISTPSGEHWIVDRQGASCAPASRHLVVRKEEVQ